MARTPKNQTTAEPIAAAEPNEAAIGQPVEGDTPVITAENTPAVAAEPAPETNPAPPEPEAPAPVEAAKELPDPLPTPGRIVHYALSADDVPKVNWCDIGTVYPGIVVAVHEDAVDLQLFLPGNGTTWAPNVSYGRNPGNWFWPPRA